MDEISPVWPPKPFHIEIERSLNASSFLHASFRLIDQRSSERSTAIEVQTSFLLSANQGRRQRGASGACPPHLKCEHVGRKSWTIVHWHRSTIIQTTFLFSLQCNFWLDIYTQDFRVFVKADGYRRSWPSVQLLADLFWKRWIKNDLPILQQRQNWLLCEYNLSVGDIVLMVDETTVSTLLHLI